MNEEESLEEQLKNLVVETCQHPQGSFERQRELNKLIRIIQRSGKIWKDSSPDYSLPSIKLDINKNTKERS
jgi:hypothetical protein